MINRKPRLTMPSNVFTLIIIIKLVLKEKYSYYYCYDNLSITRNALYYLYVVLI